MRRGRAPPGPFPPVRGAIHPLRRAAAAARPRDKDVPAPKSPRGARRLRRAPWARPARRFTWRAPLGPFGPRGGVRRGGGGIRRRGGWPSARVAATPLRLPGPRRAARCVAFRGLPLVRASLRALSRAAGRRSASSARPCLAARASRWGPLRWLRAVAGPLFAVRCAPRRSPLRARFFAGPWAASRPSPPPRRGPRVRRGAVGPRVARAGARWAPGALASARCGARRGAAAASACLAALALKREMESVLTCQFGSAILSVQGDDVPQSSLKGPAASAVGFFFCPHPPPSPVGEGAQEDNARCGGVSLPANSIKKQPAR